MHENASLITPSPLPDFLSAASGPVAVRMTNDYLFRALLQYSNKALKGLVCSLLHLDPQQVDSVEVTNPIILGASVDEKEFALDVNVLLDNAVIIDLELQVLNRHNWPEFYATYMMMNVKNFMVYSDKLRLSVVNLKATGLATGEDRLHRIDQWVAFFKAATWEEVRMLAQDNEYIREAGNTVYRLTQEEDIRQRCEAREDYYRTHRGMQRRYEEAQAELARQRAELARQETELARQKAENDALRAELERLKERSAD